MADDPTGPNNPSNAGFTRVSSRGSISDQSTDLLTELLTSSQATETSLKELIEQTKATVKALTTKGSSGDSPAQIKTNKKLDDLISAIKNLNIAGSNTGASDASADGKNQLHADATMIALTNSLQNMAKAVDDSGGGGGGGGGGRGLLDVLGAQRRVGALETSARDAYADLAQGAISFSETVDILNIELGIFGKFQDELKSVNSRLVRFGQNITDLGKAANTAKTGFDDYLKAQATGLGGFKEMFAQEAMFGTFFDNLSGDIKDSTIETFRLIRRSADSDLMSPLNRFGKNADEIAYTLKSARDGIKDQGFDSAQVMGFTEMNESMLRLVELQKRSGIMGEISDSKNQSVLATQFATLDLIARNTGQTVDELIKNNMQDMRTVADLVASGIVTTEQQGALGGMQGYLEGSGRGDIWKMVLEVAKQGGIGQGALESYLSKNEDMAKSLAATGNVENLRAIMDLVNRNMSTGDRQIEMDRIVGNMGGKGPTGVVAGSVLSEGMRSVLGQAGLTPEQFNNTQRTNSELAGATRGILDFWKNNFGTITGLSVAVIANTIALWANTAAQGGRLFGKRGGKGGTTPKKTSKLGSLKSATKAEKAGKAMAKQGKQIRDAKGQFSSLKKLSSQKKLAAKAVGKSITKKVVGLGALAGLAFGIKRWMDGDILGGVGEVASGVAGATGVGIPASLGIDAWLLKRDLASADKESATLAGANSELTSDPTAPLSKVATPNTTVSPTTGLSTSSVRSAGVVSPSTATISQAAQSPVGQNTLISTLLNSMNVNSIQQTSHLANIATLGAAGNVISSEMSKALADMYTSASSPTSPATGSRPRTPIVPYSGAAVGGGGF